MPADPTPAPEWARKMVASFESKGEYPLAELLASVRDAALREAVADLSRIFLAKWARHGADFSPEGVMLDAVDATLGALVGTAPKEA